MPFKSEAQRRWMYANEPEMAKRWEKETPKGKKLPEKVKTAFWTGFEKAAQDGFGDGGSGFTGTGKGSLGTSNEGRPTAQGNVSDDELAPQATKEFRDRERGPKEYGIFDMGQDIEDENIPHILK